MKIAENKTLCAVIVFFAAFLGYANSVTSTFHWEDEYLVRDNVHIRRLSNIPDFFRPGYVNVYEAGAGSRYRPLRTVTLALDYALWKEDPRGYHLTNVLLNAAAAAAFWFFCLSLTGSGTFSLLAGLLFALHPAHAESVAWVKNRSDILCALFCFASAGLFVLYRRNSRVLFLWLSAAAAVPAFMAKEMALTLPFMLALALVYGNLESGRDWEDGWPGLLPAFSLLAAYFIFRQLVMAGGAFGGSASGPSLPLMAAAAGEYLKTLLWPVFLSIDRPLPAAGAAWPQYAFAAVFLAGAPALWFSGRRRGALWLLLFWVLYVPVSNLVPIEGRPFAEQRLYLPSAAFCAFIAWGLTELPPAGRLARLAPALALLLAGLWGVRGFYRNLDWHSESGLWQETVRVSPSARAYNNLGVTLLREKRYQEAIASAQESLRLDPAYVDAYNTLGAGYYDLGLYDRSMAAFEKAVYFSDGRAYKSLMNLATIYSLKGREKDAVGLYAAVIRTAPWMDAAYYNMGMALNRLGRKEEALRAFGEAVALNPYNARAYQMLGGLFAERKDYKSAELAYRDLLKVEPANPFAAKFLLLNTGQSIDKSTGRP